MKEKQEQENDWGYFCRLIICQEVKEIQGEGITVELRTSHDGRTVGRVEEWAKMLIKSYLSLGPSISRTKIENASWHQDKARNFSQEDGKRISRLPTNAASRCLSFWSSLSETEGQRWWWYGFPLKFSKRPDEGEDLVLTKAIKQLTSLLRL